VFEDLVRYRLLVGAQQYGDGSFLRPPSELLEEISEELMDVVGWSFILWCRVQAMQEKIKEQQDVS